MRKISFCVFSCLLLLGCNNSKNKKSTFLVDSTTKKTRKKIEIESNNKILYGRWCGIGDTTSSFQINSDGIFYYDAIKLYKYTLSNKILKIKYDDWTSISSIKFKGNDTLIMTGLGREEGINDTLYRCYN